MSVRVDPVQLKAEARLVAAPLERSCTDHGDAMQRGRFERPARLWGAGVGVGQAEVERREGRERAEREQDDAQP